MSDPKAWTDEEAALIKLRRSEHKTWGEIAKEIGCARQTVALFAKKHGLWTEPIVPVHSTDIPSDILDKQRMPLAPGHPNTWGAIVKGTLLDGMEYPL